MPRPVECTCECVSGVACARVFLISQAALPLPSSSISGNCGEGTAGRHAVTVGSAGEVCFLTGCRSAAATLSGMGL